LVPISVAARRARYSSILRTPPNEASSEQLARERTARIRSAGNVSPSLKRHDSATRAKK